MIPDMATFAIRINDLQHEINKLDDSCSPKPIPMTFSPKEDGSVIMRIDGLAVGVPRGQVLTRDFSFDLHAGQHVFITGRNGSGKTSLVRTLMGLWKPIAGSIRLSEGTTMSCLPQDPVIYSGSLAINLGSGSFCSSASGRELYDVLRAVGLESLPTKVGGLHAPCSRAEWMVTLSPGERQRLALARLLLQRPTIAILDEASVSLDAEVELKVHEELWRKGITTITVGHRTDGLLVDRISAVINLENCNTRPSIVFKPSTP